MRETFELLFICSSMGRTKQHEQSNNHIPAIYDGHTNQLRTCTLIPKLTDYVAGAGSGKGGESCGPGPPDP